MTEIAHLVTKAAQFQEQRRSKLQDAISDIPPAKLEQEIADALKTDIELRRELKSKIAELSTEELERLLSYSAARVGGVKVPELQP